jgi:hypothetical protein
MEFSVILRPKSNERGGGLKCRRGRRGWRWDLDREQRCLGKDKESSRTSLCRGARALGDAPCMRTKDSWDKQMVISTRPDLRPLCAQKQDQQAPQSLLPRLSPPLTALPSPQAPDLWPLAPAVPAPSREVATPGLVCEAQHSRAGALNRHAVASPSFQGSLGLPPPCPLNISSCDHI